MCPRLQSVLNRFYNCEVLADIGTDHAALPIGAVRGNFCKRAIACDINEGPLKKGEANIFHAGLSEKIETRLGDGLEPLAVNEADHIVITGMGGMLIKKILKSAPEKIKKAKLILQPQHDLEEVRRFLHANMYKIEEELVQDRSKFYVTVAAVKTSEAEQWTDAEYFLGKLDYFDLFSFFYLKALHEKISGYIHSITDEDARVKAKKQLKWISEGIQKHGNG